MYVHVSVSIYFFQIWFYYKFPIFWASVLCVIMYVDECVYESEREKVDCVHGVCKWMQGHNENIFYI